MNVHTPFLYAFTALTFIISLFALEVSFLELTDHNTITFDDATGALVADFKEAELYEGYPKEIDINQDAVADTTLTLKYADNGKAIFTLKNAENPCKAR